MYWFSNICFNLISAENNDSVSTSTEKTETVTESCEETNQSNAITESHDQGLNQSAASTTRQLDIVENSNERKQDTTEQKHVKDIFKEFLEKVGGLVFTDEIKSLKTNELVVVNQTLMDVQSSIADMQNKIVTELTDRCNNTRV